MRAARGVVAALACLVVPIAASGCGYSSRRLIDHRRFESVAILQFDNRTFRRDLEFRVTRAVAEEVRARTRWRIATPSDADTWLRGTIRTADTAVLAEEADRTPIAQRYRVVVDVEWVEHATGRVLRRYAVTARQEFTEGRFGESLEGSTTDAVATALAKEVVEGLERPIGCADTVPLARPARPETPR